MSAPDASGEGGPAPADGVAAAIAQARDWLAEGRPDRAADLLEALLAREPGCAVAWDELGRARNNLRRLPAAEAAFREALRRDDGLASAWNHLGHVLRALGRPEEAHAAFVRAVELAPDDAGACRNLADSLLQRDEAAAAAALLQRLLARRPEDAAGRLGLAYALQKGGDAHAAIRQFRRALELEPGNADGLAGLGAAEHATGDYEAAGRSYRAALALDPAHPVAASGLAAVLEIEGRHGEAFALLEPRLAAPAPPPALAVAGARQLRRLGRIDEALALLDRVPAATAEPADLALLDHTRGWLFEEAGDAAAAFEHHRRANDRLERRFDAAGFRRMVERLTGFFTAARLAALPRAGVKGPAPVFIVGMPRSGTSLVEQILAAHGAVQAGGERTELFHFVRELADGDPESNWPAALAGTTSTRLGALAGRYLEGLAGGEALRTTDKLPANFLNLGLVELLFPEARVVYCRRDPLDTGLSCYFQSFRSEGMAFARRLADIAVYQQGCLRLMDHWRRVSRLPIHVVDYESLVTDLEGGARALVAFLGLSWEDACLRPDRVRRVVRTASVEQVRRPVYVSSVGRWRRYERELAPLRAALAAPWSGQTASPEGRGRDDPPPRP